MLVSNKKTLRLLMKKNTLFVSRAVLIYMAAVLVCLSPGRVLANHGAINIKNIAPPKGQPFCKFTLVDQHGRSTKLSTSMSHATSKSLTFIFHGGEKLIITFTHIRAGHFVAESARSKDPQIIFYTSHDSAPIPMVGAVMISSVKPVAGNFSHLLSYDHDEHITLVAGTFNM